MQKFVLKSLIAFSSCTLAGELLSVPALGPGLFFEAQEKGINPKEKMQTFEGDVVAIGAGVIIAADYIELDQGAQLLKAIGHIIIMTHDQIYQGQEMIYQMKTGDFKLFDAQMIANDKAQVEIISKKILGFTKSERDFEVARQARLNEIRQKKSALLIKARKILKDSKPVSDDLIQRYAVLIEQEEATQKQTNPALAQMHEDTRSRYQQRRQYWEANFLPTATSGAGNLSKAYFRIDGESIERTNGNDFYAESSIWTPCKCEDDESPAWGFRSDHTEAQPGGYADLYHPVLMIKGVPVLYLPFLKVPLKDRRQSGFLMPTISFEPKSGNIFSQPVYFDLAENRDVTVTTDIFEKRGTRIGAEYRYQQRKYSGWEVQLEGIRDRIWLEERGIREDILGLYLNGLDSDQVSDGRVCPGYKAGREAVGTCLEDPDWWQKNGYPLDENGRVENADDVKATVRRELNTPDNSWRGAYKWKGVSFFAPRLSFVSKGEIVSDHRYADELDVPNDFDIVFGGGAGEKSISQSSGQLNLDGSDFYLGLGTHHYDNYLLSHRFEGQHIPMRLKLQTKMVNLVPERYSIPLYMHASLENILIQQIENKESDNYAEPNLGDGSWRRLKFDLVSPLVTDSIVKINHFSDFETRYIGHSNLVRKSSEIRSWRAGLEFVLPIDGKGPLPDWLSTEESENSTEALPASYVHHIMDFRFRFSARPAVVRTGPYLDPELDDDDRNQAYFAGDRGVPSESQSYYEEDLMREHQRVTFSTNHRWRLFRRKWNKFGDSDVAGTEDFKELTTLERARKELLYTLDRPVTSLDGLVDSNENDWKGSRYRLTEENYAEPLRFSANISYDRNKDIERQEQREINDSLPSEQHVKLSEPWDGPNASVGISYSDWVLENSTEWNLYQKKYDALKFRLLPPALFSSRLALGYNIYRKPSSSLDQDFIVEKERVGELTSSLIPNFSTNLSVTRIIQEGQDVNYTRDYKVALGLQYLSPSKCWGLNFLRQKERNADERNATYSMRLSVIFVGQQRELSNMSKGVTRRLRSEEDEPQ